MLSYVLRRLIVGLIQVVAIIVVTFAVLRLLPEDPASVFAGSVANGASRAAVAHQLGLDKPIIDQLGTFLSTLVSHGSLGNSWISQTSVFGQIGSHITVTLELVLSALLIAVVLGTALGYWLAAADSAGRRRHRRPLVALGKGFILTSGSQPEFWWGLVFIEVFFVVLRWFPVPIGILGANLSPPRTITGFLWFDALVQGQWAVLGSFIAHMVLPVATISLVLTGPIAKVARESMLPVMASPYYTNLRVQGAGRWRMFRCVVRNGGAPVVMLLGVLFGAVLGAAALVETVFSINGLSHLTVQSILGADYPMVDGCVAPLGTLSIAGYLIADLVAVWLNPSLRQRTRDRSLRARTRPGPLTVDVFGDLTTSAAAAVAGEPMTGPQ
jgi:ABC-type dipeptide/oligopeptide/nickel transport system permease component